MDADQVSLGQSTMRRVMWRVMPLIVLMMMLAVIDRSNVAFAKLQMVRALSMTEVAYGFASSLFFIGYLVFEVPSALAAHRFGARLWFARIVLTWGVLTVALAYVSSGSWFAALRFLVGSAEAGSYPGMIYYLTLWFPRQYRVQAVALLTLGSPLGNMFGSLFGGTLLAFDGAFGLAGWQWVFVVTGLPAILLAVAIYLALPDRPASSTFLPEAEKNWLVRELAAEANQVPSHAKLWRVFIDPRVLVQSLVYINVTLALYGVIYWLPTVIRDFGASPAQNGLLSAIPWGVAAAVLVWLPRYMRSEKSVLVATIIVAAVGIASFTLSTLPVPVWLRYLALSVGTPCVSMLFPCFWYFPPRLFKGAQSAAAIGIVSTIASLGGFGAQNLMPWVAATFGSAASAMAVPAIAFAILGSVAMVLLVRRPLGGDLPDEARAGAAVTR